MLFNSIAFIIFFPLVCLVYFLLPHRFRWVFLLVASYYFYMNWEPTYALLIFTSTAVTYVCGRLVEKYREDKSRKKLFLIANLAINLGILFLFKYYNFINNTVFEGLDYLGIHWPIPNFDILLPVGISFYTFQAVGYSIDVYRGDIQAERHFGIYALFVSFFPQLVAGPIERAKNLLAQFYVKHTFNYPRAVLGLRQMLWGFFMKLVVADRVSMYVNAAYNNAEQHTGTTLLLATVFFTFQIYCDFAGYSNIAIGAARIMGFDLMENFRRPYFSTSMQQFWKRWHISLSTWFQDYVYIPLGGSRVKYGRHLFNLFVTFLVSGIWHGANWTFVAWGALHGTYLIVENVKTKYIGKSNTNNIVIMGFNILLCSVLAMAGWVFFRANSIGDGFKVLRKIFADHGALFIDVTTIAYGLFGIFVLVIKDFIDEFYPEKHLLFDNRHVVVRWSLYIFILAVILSCGVFDGGQFIYFQF